MLEGATLAAFILVGLVAVAMLVNFVTNLVEDYREEKKKKEK